MGKWVVVAQYGAGERYVTEVISRVTGTREHAEEAMLLATRSYGAPMREKWREVFRLAGGGSCLVRVKGATTLREITLTIGELVHDSKDWDMWADGPQDRPPAP